jgi:hypothetical protein
MGKYSIHVPNHQPGMVYDGRTKSRNPEHFLYSSEYVYDVYEHNREQQIRLE